MPPGYPRLSVESLNQIREWMNTVPSQLIINQFGRIIYGRDIRRLRIGTLGVNPQGLWLDDQIINQYFDLLIDCTRHNEHSMMHAIESHFWSLLRGCGYERAKQIAGNVDIFQCDKVFIPIHLNGNHWGLAVIQPHHREITYYDSMGQTSDGGEDVVIKLEEYIKYDSMIQHKTELDTSQWRKINVTNIPKQTNSHDCGVFVCAYAEAIARNQHNFTFTQQHMQYFRNRIAYEIGTGQMLR